MADTKFIWTDGTSDEISVTAINRDFSVKYGRQKNLARLPSEAVMSTGSAMSPIELARYIPEERRSLAAGMSLSGLS